jgi:hypothetical protein
LKGLPQAQAAALTDSRGAASRYEATRFDGRQPPRNAVTASARATCHATATIRHSLAIAVTLETIASDEGIAPSSWLQSMNAAWTTQYTGRLKSGKAR